MDDVPAKPIKQEVIRDADIRNAVDKKEDIKRLKSR
jgi:hypothetical protein